MSDNVAPPGGRIFISYRREETAYPAGWLYDRLRVRYAGQVFKDVDSIEPGDDFVEAITRAVASCDVLLALIGDQWLTVTNADGRRRIDDPEDFVRVEIEAALTRNVRVIPILIDGATMPRAEELPQNLAKLVRRQALDLSPSRFDFDMSRLLRVLDATLLEMRDRDLPRSTTAVLWRRDAEGPDRPAAADPPRLPPVYREPDDERRRRPRSALIVAVAGGALLIALVILAVLLFSPAARPPASSPSPSPSSPPTGTPVFSENFTSRANGWSIASDWAAAKATYVPGAYRLSVPVEDRGAAAWGFPVKATPVYPNAPQDLRVEVDGRRLPGADESTEYGVLCHSGPLGDGYVLTVADGHAKVMRVGDAGYQVLIERDTPVDAAATNRVRAECTTVDGQRAVRLVLWVNAQKVADYTDTNDPLVNGTVGVHVGTLENSTTTGAAEFDNFEVTEI